jgi:hypothetical protein
MSRSRKTSKRAKQAHAPSKTEPTSSKELTDTQLEQVAGGAPKADATGQELLTYKLTEVLISSVS